MTIQNNLIVMSESGEIEDKREKWKQTIGHWLMLAFISAITYLVKKTKVPLNLLEMNKPFVHSVTCVHLFL